MLKNFHKKKLKEIKWWAWFATVGPIVALAGLFFINIIGLHNWVETLLTIGAIIMFTIAVIWWWWAIWTIAKVTDILSNTVDRFDVVQEDLKTVKKGIRELDQSSD